MRQTGRATADLDFGKLKFGLTNPRIVDLQSCIGRAMFTILEDNVYYMIIMVASHGHPTTALW